MYDDRIEVYSPGGMFDGINVQDRDIMHVPSRRRNPIIADMFSRLGYMERRGSGFKKIIEDYQFQQNYSADLAPVFLSQYDTFFLTLKNLNYAQGNVKGNVKEHEKVNETNRIKGTGGKVFQRADMIADYLKSHPQATIATMSEEFGLTRKQVVSALDLLKNQNRVQYKGASRNGHLEVND